MDEWTDTHAVSLLWRFFGFFGGGGGFGRLGVSYCTVQHSTLYLRIWWGVFVGGGHKGFCFISNRLDVDIDFYFK